MQQQNGQQNTNGLKAGPRMGMQPFNPRTSEYTFTRPGGDTQTVNRGNPNMEGLTEPAKKVGMANFMDAIMPQLLMGNSGNNRPALGNGMRTNPIAQLLARKGRV